MDNNLYAAPKSDVTRPDLAPGSIPKAVLVGVSIDLLGTMFTGFVAGIVYGIVMVSQGHSPQEIQDSMAHMDMLSPLSLIVSVCGILLSLYGGYRCAVIANRPTWTAPLIMAGVVIAVSSMLNTGTYSPLVYAGLSLLTLGTILGGAFLHMRKLKPA